MLRRAAAWYLRRKAGQGLGTYTQRHLTARMAAALGQSAPSDAGPRTLAQTAIRAFAIGDTAEARSIAQRISQGSQRWQQVSPLSQAVFDLSKHGRALFQIEPPGGLVCWPAHSWGITQSGGGWRYQLTGPESTNGRRVVETFNAQDSQLAAVFMPGVDPLRVALKDAAEGVAAEAMLDDMAHVRERASFEMDSAILENDLMTVEQLEDYREKMVEEYPNMVKGDMPPIMWPGFRQSQGMDRGSFATQAEAALKLLDRIDGVPVSAWLGSGTGAIMARLVIDDICCRLLTLCQPGLSRLAGAGMVEIRLPSTDLERRGRAVGQLVKNEILDRDEARRILGQSD